MIRKWKYVSAITDTIIGLGIVYLGLLRFPETAPKESPVITSGQELWEFSILFAHEFWFIIIPMGILSLSIGLYKFYILKEEKYYESKAERLLSNRKERGLA